MEEKEIDLRVYWRILLKWKRTIIALVMAGTLLSVFVSLLLPNIYRAEAVLMPVGGGRGAGLSMMSAQPGLGSFLGGGFGSAFSPATQLLAILRSRTLAERVIEKFDLMGVFYKVEDPGEIPQMESVVNHLFSLVEFTHDLRNQVVHVSVEMKDPKLAAEIANGYLNELDGFVKEKTLTTAKRNRVFVENQLERNKAELLESGKELTEFYATNRISNVLPKVDVAIGQEVIPEATGALVGDVKSEGQERDSLPVSFSAMPGVSSAWADVQKKTEGFQKEADAIRNSVQKALVVKDVPERVFLQYLTLRRQLLEQVNTLLTQQYEMAKIEEAKEDLTFQVIDWARVPITRFSPQRRKIVMIAFAVSLFLAIFYVFFRESLGKMKLKSS